MAARRRTHSYRGQSEKLQISWPYRPTANPASDVGKHSPKLLGRWKGRWKVNERNIQRMMEKCRHFNGVQSKVCKAGINYDDVVPIPCIGLRGATIQPAKCEKKSYYTRDEAAKIELEHEEHTKKFMLALNAAHEAAKALGLKKGRGGGGSCECPVCHGTLNFSVASYNGHLWGKCETKGCMAWMQ